MNREWIVNEDYADNTDWGEKEYQREKRRLQREKKKRQKRTHHKNRYDKKYNNPKDVIYDEDDDFEYGDM